VNGGLIWDRQNIYWLAPKPSSKIQINQSQLSAPKTIFAGFIVLFRGDYN